MSNEILDVITRLHYEVVGADSLLRVTEDFKKQAKGVEILRLQLERMKAARDKAAGNPQAEAAYQKQIDETTKKIQLHTAALTTKYQSSAKLQQQLKEEIGTIGQLTNKIKELTAARSLSTNDSVIKGLSKEIGNAKQQLKELTEIAAVTSNSGGVLSSLFGGVSGATLGRQALQGVLGGLGIGVGFSVVPAIIGSLTELAVAEYDVTGKAVKLQAANESLAKSFADLGAALQDYNEDQRLLDIGKDILGQVPAIEELKRSIERIKAIGATNGEQYELEKKSLDASLQLRNEELAQLKIKEETNARILKLMQEIDKLSVSYFNDPKLKEQYAPLDPRNSSQEQKKLGGLITGLINQYDIPNQLKEKVSLSVMQDIKTGSKMLGNYEGPSLADVATRDLRAYSVTDAKIRQEIADKEAEIENEKLSFQREQAEKIRVLNQRIDRELADSRDKRNQEQIKANEQYNLNELQHSIKTVEIIKEGAEMQIKALTELNASELKQRLRKNEQDRADQKRLLSLPEDASLPPSVANRFANIDADIIEDQRRKLENSTRAAQQKAQEEIFAYNRALFIEQEDALAKQASARARQLQLTADFALPDYDKMLQAADAAREADLQNEKTNHFKLLNEYREKNIDISDIETEHQNKILEIEQAHYNKRLAIAGDYFKQIVTQNKLVNDLLLTEAETSLLNEKTEIRRSGGNNILTDRKLSRADLRAAISRAQTDTLNKQNDLIPANEVLDRAKADRAKATTEAQIKAADINLIAASQKVEDLKKKIAENNLSIEESFASFTNLRVQETQEQINIFQTFVNATVEGYNIIAEARQQDLDREIDVRTQRVDMAYKLAERGNVEALKLEKDALDKSTAERRRQALITQSINAALTTSNAILAVAQAAVAGKGVLTPALIAAVIGALAIGFSEARAITVSQRQKFKDGVIDIAGPGTETSDSIPASISKGESVITAAGTRKNRSILERINNGEVIPLHEAPKAVLPQYPVMAPLQSIAAMQNNAFATQKEVNVLGAKLDTMIETLEHIAGKDISVENRIKRGDFALMVTQEQKENYRKYTK